MLDVVAILAAARDPFPGLRAFQVDESLKFFGRDAQIHDVLDRLSGDRLVAVVGSSGCGKSSLVRAGVIPALQRGYLHDTTSRWRTIVMRPGAAPMSELAAVLERDASLASSAASSSKLGATSAGLSEVVAGIGLDDGESMLLVVDQFEELFTFNRGRSVEERAQTALFVRQLLHATDQTAVPIYVILTMRSDFLGDCARFTGLAEALTRGQYLVPRMTREQRRECIVRPLRLVDATASPALVEQLLNDAGDDGDDLPVMQHALARTYERWCTRKAGDVLLDDYIKIGTVADAIANHGEEVLGSLSADERQGAQKIFRVLTNSVDGRATRRPTRLETIHRILNAGSAEQLCIERLIRTFAQRGNGFLTLSDEAMRPDTMVDITHESLLRKWPTLAAWAKEEARSADWYRDLCRDVERNRTGDAGLWSDPDLSTLVARRDQEGWNTDWARQYEPSEQPSFEQANAFVTRSIGARDEARLIKAALARRERRLKGGLAAASFLVLAVSTIAGFALLRQSQAQLELSTRLQQLQVSASGYTDETTRLQDEVDALRQQIALRPSDASGDLKSELAAKQKELESTQKLSDDARAQIAKLSQERTASDASTKAIIDRVDQLQRELDAARKQNAELETKLTNALATVMSPTPTIPPAPTVPPGQTTSPSTQPAPPSDVGNDELAIRRVMSRYAQAYNQRDVAMLKSIYPSVPNAEGLEKVFRDMRDYRLSVSNLQIEIDRSLAAARVTGVIEEQFASGSSSSGRSSTARRTWQLQKQGGQWFVTSIR